MGLESRLNKLEQHLSIRGKKDFPTFVSFTSEEWKILNNEQSTQEEKDLILTKHNVLGTRREIKTYVGVSPDDWNDGIIAGLKVYVGLDIDRI